MNGGTPLWVEALTALLVVVGALAALIGSFGVLRLRSFFRRVHAPTLGATVGTWGFTLATAVQVSYERGQLYLHALLITVFIALTAPVTTIFLMRAAVFRGRLRGEEIPVPGTEEPSRG
ncbi:Na+/H+ antiporter subunit G [Pyxidicoccus fallax]|uniref:Na+/H+ antiporter subunit G n=1 Tax=Pyxidicoccus fallax TaxID=394095 RepID=A0A848LLG1_9BACT|nr:monovalent cation/H(+) antiporter subunit G [Pyxidicoccus fallax]NMO18645.1 Na+/H+ antiporter subunit G [Pyxidicoccus fallax]NPC79050.1 Na+/H+ antiporter subunit G [Pyxidicoccus fallax]